MRWLEGPLGYLVSFVAAALYLCEKGADVTRRAYRLTRDDARHARSLRLSVGLTCEALGSIFVVPWQAPHIVYSAVSGAADMLAVIMLYLMALSYAADLAKRRSERHEGHQPR